MAWLNFFAVGTDYRTLVEFMYEDAGLLCCEAYSEYDSELRYFRTVGELEQAFPFDRFQVQLMFWSPEIRTDPEVRRIDLTVPGNHIRYTADGLGLIQLLTPPVAADHVQVSWYSHREEAGARAGAGTRADAVQWKALRRISGRIQRFIKRSSVTRVENIWVMPAAGAAIKAGAAMMVYGRQLRPPT